MKMLLVGGTRDGECIEHDPLPTVIFPLSPPIVGVMATDKDSLPPMPWDIHYDTEVYIATKLTNGSRVWIEQKQCYEMQDLFYRGEAALNRARQYAKDADELNSRVLAQMAADEVRIARSSFARSNDLCHPRRNNDRLED